MNLDVCVTVFRLFGIKRPLAPLTDNSKWDLINWNAIA